MALLAFQWPGCLLQQHPPARRNSPLLERDSFESWQLVSCLAGSSVVSAGRSHTVGVSSEVPRGLAWRGMLWIVGLGRNAMGQCLAAAKQPRATGDTGVGKGWTWARWWCRTPVLSSVLCHPLLLCMHSVHAGVATKLGRREGMKKKKTS